ncbi:hypothetical protein ACLX1H_003020 [Fusarium chlamydosporum]
MTTSNPIATITNNSGFDVEIYDVFNPSTDTSNPGPLTYTLLATVPNGTTSQKVQTIHFASQLQAMLTGNIAALNGNYYQQFPVAVMAVSPFKDTNDTTITSNMLQSMVDSFKFIKYSQANPSSQLATKFRAALGDKKSQKDAVNSFFQSSGSFKLCTITTWTATFTWQAQFTNPWQGTYYLYTLGKGASGSSAPALTATLAITASANDNSAVLTMSDTNGENTPVAMAGDGSMQEKDQGMGNLSVALKPTWLNVSQTSKDDPKKVNFVIGAAFTGTINGVKVAGNLNKLAVPDPSDKSKNADNKNSANDWSLNKLEGLVGMLTSIGMLYYMAKGHKQAETQKKDNAEKDAKTKEDAQKSEEKVESDYQANDVPEIKNQSDKVDAIVPDVQQGYKEVNQAQDIQNKQDTIREQERQLEEILEGGAPSTATEDTAMNLSKAQKDLESAMDPNATVEARDTALTDASTTLTDTSAKIKEAVNDQASNLPEEERKALDDTQEALDQVQEQAEASEQAQEEREQENEKSTEEEVEEGQFEDPEA